MHASARKESESPESMGEMLDRFVTERLIGLGISAVTLLFALKVI